MMEEFLWNLKTACKRSSNDLIATLLIKPALEQMAEMLAEILKEQM